MILKEAWDKRNKLRTEGYKLHAEARKLWAEGNKLYDEEYKLYDEIRKLWAEADKLYTEGNKLYDEGYRIYAQAVIDFFGYEAIINWSTGEVSGKPLAIPVGEFYDS